MTISFSGAAVSKQRVCPSCKSVGTISFWKKAMARQQTLMGKDAPEGELERTNPHCTKCGKVFPMYHVFERERP